MMKTVEKQIDREYLDIRAEYHRFPLSFVRRLSYKLWLCFFVGFLFTVFFIL